MSTTRLLFTGLLDDAAMFPPGNAAVAEAVAAHLAYRSAWFSDLVGPLLVRATRWAELVEAHARAGGPALAVVVIGATVLPSDVPDGLDVVGFEVAPQPQVPLPAAARPTAFEITQPALADEVMHAVVARRGAGSQDVAKFRTGGTEAAAFPGVQTLAGVIVAAARAGAPLKFTAGLHHAVRAVDPTTGFDHHGFLNLLVAVQRAVAGADLNAVVHALDERDGNHLTDVATGWTPAEVTAVREVFRSFGCCGVTDPVDDLVRLGLLTPRAGPPAGT